MTNNIEMIFRFVTPALITVAIFLLRILINELREVKIGFNNHLEHHRELEKELAGRLSCLETIDKYILGKEVNKQ